MSKIIEIPFGAKDSENKGWEYTIPAGMEAVIEDGKVIVREKESEDERIRKLLVWQVYRNIEDETNDLAQSVHDGIKGHDPDIEESIEDWKKCLAYLEKQKEQPKEELVYRLNGLMQDYVKEGKDEEEKEHRFKCYQLFWDTLEDANFFEQKEQPTYAKSERVIKAARSVLNNWLDGTDCPDASGDFAELEYAIREYDGEERQKEQKPVEQITKDNEIISNPEYNPNYHDELSQCKDVLFNIATILSKYEDKEESPLEQIRSVIVDSVAHGVCLEEGKKEQKPAEWKPQPESLEALMYAIEGKWEMIKPTSYLSRRLEDLYDGLVNTHKVDETLLDKKPVAHENDFVSKPAEWSEEDEKFFETALWHISYSVSNRRTTDYHCDTTDWLKGVKERLKSFRPQPKQEWSEEDEETLEKLHRLLVICRGEKKFIQEVDYNKMDNLLKSLRLSWKPSEEQIEALLNTLHPDDPYFLNLKSLYEQLKKL